MIQYLYECLTIIESEFPNNGTILLGDFNKLKVSRIQNAFKLKQVVKFPTRGRNILDLILTDLDKFYDSPRKLPPFGLSDHDSVFVPPLARSQVPNPTYRTKSRDLRPTKRLALTRYLEEVNVNQLVNKQISCDDKAKTFEMIINTGLDAIAPIKEKVITTNEPPWVSSSFKKLIRNRQKAFTQGDLMAFRKLRNQVNRERKKLRAKYYDAKVKQLESCAPATWWKEIKRLSGISEHVSRREDMVSMLSNIERNSDPNSPGEAELANEINQAFLRPMTDFTPLLPNYWQTNTDGRSEAFCVSEFSVFKKLIALNPNKAEGPDGIPNWILKENADLLAIAVTDIINTSYKESRLPSSWKFANIIPIPKAKPVRNVNKDLRPISLTPIISKIAEDYVVNSFVKPAVLKKLDPNQYGTVPRSSTTQALISMLHFLNASTDGNGATTRVVLFDYKKAFDLIDHTLLLNKLATYDIPQWVLEWITDFLTHRKQRVKLSQDCFSEWELVPAGVPQGTKLGPWLFVIMVNDLDIPNSELWRYVDDTSMAEAILKGGSSTIQNDVDELINQSVVNKFQMNEGKCKEMRIGFSKLTTHFEPIKIHNNPLELVKCAKILGLIVSNDLKWNEHVQQITKKARKRLYCLTQLKRANVGTKELLQFYITCIRPITEYASPVFHNSLTNYLSNELEAIQQRALKIILPWTSYGEALSRVGLQTLYARRQELTESLFRDIESNVDHKLYNLLPPLIEIDTTLRNKSKYNVTFKTERFRNSFITYNALKS